MEWRPDAGGRRADPVVEATGYSLDVALAVRLGGRAGRLLLRGDTRFKTMILRPRWHRIRRSFSLGSPLPRSSPFRFKNTQGSDGPRTPLTASLDASLWQLSPFEVVGHEVFWDESCERAH